MNVFLWENAQKQKGEKASLINGRRYCRIVISRTTADDCFDVVSEHIPCACWLSLRTVLSSVS